MQVMKKSTSGDSGQGCGISFALLWIGFSLFLTLIVWNSQGFPDLLFPLVFVGIGVILLVGMLWRYLAGVKVVQPNISVSKDTLRIGESFNVIYEQEFRQVTETQSLTIQLIFRESATYTRGTDTRTDKHDTVLGSFEDSGGRFERGEIFSHDCSFTIPDNAMHTFVADKNKLQWFVSIHIDILNWPDLHEEYEIFVLPDRMR